jgi:hypothetical protein
MRILPVTFVASIAAVVGLGGLGAACGSGSSGSHAGATGDDASSEGSVQPTPEAGGGSEGSTSDDAAPEAAGYPAWVETDIPQMVARSTTGVMPLPKVIPVFFTGDDPSLTASLQDFVTKLGATVYWGVTSEYGVGQVVGEQAIQLTAADTPPTIYSEEDLDAWISNKVLTDPAFETGDANTIYALFFPPGVTIEEGAPSSGFPSDAGADASSPSDAGLPAGVSASCVDFGGYHSAVQLASGAVAAYAVMPRCTSFDGLVGIDGVTAAASHEIAEAATDPVNQGWHGTDAAHSYYGTVLGGGGEIGDLCAQSSISFLKFPELPYTVQRLWSNKAALTGLDPCVPVPAGEVYFNVVPVMPDTLQAQTRAADGGTTVVPTQGVQIAIGATKTIELDCFSTAPTSSAMSVHAYDEYDLGLATAQQLTFTFDTIACENGGKVHMTIKAVAAGRRNTEPFLLYTSLKDGSNTVWAGVVGQ